MTDLKRLFPQSIRNLFHLCISLTYNVRYGFPSRKLNIIGITGTDGKTTTANMLYAMLTGAGENTGLISSINAKMGQKEYPIGFHVTSPDSKLLQHFLRRMVDQEITTVVLETTSHGLHQHRFGGITFDACVFTNITHEHLDYHKTYKDYLHAKAALIRKTRKTGFTILNRDDISYPELSRIAENHNVKTFTYGTKGMADFEAANISEEDAGTSFTLVHQNKKTEITLPLPGLYNVYNALAATAVAMNKGISSKTVATVLGKFTFLNGRWELIQNYPFQVVVDFAHTPNALEQVLTTARKQKAKLGRIIVVFGCAGLRDVSKRPMMGEIAGRLADITIMTAEDPRVEDVNDINKHIEKGLLKHKKISRKDYFSIPDRKKAIQKAIALAKPGDIVIITGKGHEQSMNLDGIHEIPWSDQKVTREILSSDWNSNHVAAAKGYHA